VIVVVVVKVVYSVRHHYCMIGHYSTELA